MANPARAPFAHEGEGCNGATVGASPPDGKERGRELCLGGLDLVREFFVGGDGVANKLQE